MQYISSKNIIARVHRNLNIKHDLRFNDMIEWVYEALQLVNTAPQHEARLVELIIEDYTAELPCDLHQIRMVSQYGYGLTYRPMEYYYNYASVKDPKNYPINSEKTYDIRYPYIHVNFEEGEVMLEYYAVKLDEEGMPMIPDLESFKQLVFWYISRMLMIGGFEFKNRELTLRYCDMQVKHYVGAAKADSLKPSLAQMEKYKRERQRQIPAVNHYHSAFRHYGNQERVSLEGWAREAQIHNHPYTNY